MTSQPAGPDFAGVLVWRLRHPLRVRVGRTDDGWWASWRTASGESTVSKCESKAEAVGALREWVQP